MTEFTVLVAKSINSEYASRNVVYYKSLPGAPVPRCFLFFPAKGLIKEAVQCYLKEMKEGYLYLNAQDRAVLEVAFEEKLTVQVVDRPPIAQSMVVALTDKTKQTLLKRPSEDLIRLAKSKLINSVVNADTYTGFYAPEINYVQVVSLVGPAGEMISHGYVDETTEILVVNLEKSQFKLELSTVNFEQIGVGGLEKEFTELMKAIFITRIIPEKIFQKLNIKHMKGAVLYGPPGCGKTRIARQIGALIGCKNIKIINGPELLNKYVGESEKNVRDCFEQAQRNPDELHMLIFDEFDSIGARRSGSDSNNNYSDKVVGQLLTMLDGVDEINNLIVFALTNRLDIIDPALLRPGRFGLHLKIDLPNLKGREEILSIHSTALRTNGLFTDDLDLHHIAELTENYTGAELESLVQITVQQVLGSQIDFNNIVESANQINDLRIGPSDFLAAMTKITPMFPPSQQQALELQTKIRKVLSPADLEIKADLLAFLKSKDYPVVCCLAGGSKTGKTSLAVATGLAWSEVKVEYVSAAQLVSLSDRVKLERLIEVFSSPVPSLIILDNIEMIIEFVSEQIFHRGLLHQLKVLLGETRHCVLITTSYYHRLTQMTVLDAVQYVQTI